MTLTIQPNSSGSRELRLECQKSLHSTWHLVVRDFFKYKFQTFASVAQVVAQVPSYHRATESGEGLRLTVEGSQQVLNHLNTATLHRVIKGIVAETIHSAVFWIKVIQVLNTILIYTQKQYKRLRNAAQKRSEQYIKSDFVLF